MLDVPKIVTKIPINATKNMKNTDFPAIYFKLIMIKQPHKIVKIIILFYYCILYYLNQKKLILLKLLFFTYSFYIWWIYGFFLNLSSFT